MDTDRIDLSALDPSADDGRWERMVLGIMERAAPELARRAGDHGPLTLLVGWARPMLAAAAVLAALAAGVLLRGSGPVRLHATASSGVVEALEVPEPAANWLLEDRSPTVADLILALENESR